MITMQSVPDGYSEAVAYLNSMPQDVVAELCQEVLAFLTYKKGSLESAPFVPKLQAAGLEASTESVRGAANALSYLFRSAARNQISGEDLGKELSGSLAWSDSNIAAVKHVWNQQGRSLMSPELADVVLGVGKLVDLKWKLGVAMSSNNCRNLNSPFITISLKVADPSGQVRERSFELTVPEFRNFSKQLKEMAAVLETV
ncbi:COMM domain-containing protein 6-like [Diadema antillarum]|uniref:COMM domain-containing protein 6-like n=1 Tax=Diadema antillarum TaxID=105358 RepID=UPI003A8A127B